MRRRIAADGTRQPRKPDLPVARQPTLRRADRNPRMAGGVRKRDVVFKMGLKNGKPLHCQPALLLL